MTSREFIAAEAGNTDRIILYREGLFWKAYERSAFALCSQVRPLKPTRKVLKSLDGGDLISVGFPSASESTTLGDLAVIERSDDRLTVSAPRTVDEREFTVWKSSVPVKVSVPKPRPAAEVDSIAGLPVHFTSTASSDISASAVVRQRRVSLWGRLTRALRGLFGCAGPQPVAEASEFSGTLSAPASVGDIASLDSAGCNSSEASVQRIVQSLKDFNLADKTPMECMLFISELKNMLVKR